MNPNLIHPDDEDREYELNRELAAMEGAMIAGRLMPDTDPDPDGTESDDLYHIEAPAPHDDEHGDDSPTADQEYPTNGPKAADDPYDYDAINAKLRGDHGPLAATLSDRTLDKVLSRPAHVPSIVMLDRDAAAHRLADAGTDLLVLISSFAISEPKPEIIRFRQALADYRETTR